jgi:dTDP-4-dehydrorhamnose 3,5-epimerase
VTELEVPEVVEDPFREHYRELIRASLLRAAEESTHGRGRARRRRAERTVALLAGAPASEAPAEPVPAPVVEAPAPAPEPPRASEREPPPAVAPRVPPSAPPATPQAAAAPVLPIVVPADDARFRRRLLLATRAVWLAAVVLLVCDALAFGIESWATGIADIGVLALTLVWFAVSAETSRARRAAAAVPPPGAPPARADPVDAPAETIDGVRIVALRMGRDAGGHVTELLGDPALSSLGSPARWQVLSCRAGTLRGMHAHLHADGLRIVVDGRAGLGLKDLRPGSPSEGRSQLLELSGDEYAAVVVPAGVAHGLFAETDALVLLALTAGEEEEEHGCAWNDSGLGIAWPGEPLFLSERDRRAGPLEVLRAEIAARTS